MSLSSTTLWEHLMLPLQLLELKILLLNVNKRNTYISVGIVPSSACGGLQQAKNVRVFHLRPEKQVD